MSRARRPLTAAVRRGLRSMRSLAHAEISSTDWPYGGRRAHAAVWRAMEWIDSLPDEGEPLTRRRPPHKK